MKQWEKIQQYRAQYKNNALTKAEFIEKINAELAIFEGEQHFKDELSLATQQLLYFQELIEKYETQNKALATENETLKLKIINLTN